MKTENGSTLKTMRLLFIVWLLAVLFSAIMFTMSLMYDVISSLIISSITCVLSCVGIFYTSYLIMRLESSIENNKKM